MGMFPRKHMLGGTHPARKGCVMLKRFVCEEDGATMVEYGLMVALIAVVMIVIVSTLGQSLKNSFARTNTAVTNANTADATAVPGAPVPTP